MDHRTVLIVHVFVCMLILIN